VAAPDDFVLGECLLDHLGSVRLGWSKLAFAWIYC